MTDALELLRLREKLKRDEPLTLPEQRWLAWRGERAMSGAGDVERLIAPARAVAKSKGLLPDALLSPKGGQ